MDQPVVIIAGASRGLGAAIAIQAAKLGARTVLAARSQEGLEKTAGQISSMGGAVVIVQADITVADSCESIVRQAVKHFGRIDALVNNLGQLNPIGQLARMDAAAWLQNLNVNLVAPALMIQKALPHLIESKGRIINVSSGAADMVFQGWGAYSAAKAGLNMLTRVLAEEEPAVTALAVKPGVVDTSMQESVRKLGSGNMSADNYAYFVSLFEKGKLLPPDVPGKTIASLALHVPHEWSGQCVSWNEEKVKGLLAG